MKYRRLAPTQSTKRLDRLTLVQEIASLRLSEYEARLPTPQFLNGWPLCRHCRQSCTGSYNGTPRCFRCDNRRMTAVAA